MKLTHLAAPLVIAASILLFTSCNMKESNPLLSKSNNPYGAPSFDKITNDDYKPAFEASIAAAKKEVEAIVNNSDEPTFENTVEALAYAGRDLTTVGSIFYNLNESCTNPAMQQIAEDLSPIMTEYSMSIMLNPDLFKRIKAVYDNRANLNLNLEQAKLLDDIYKSFARNGANLSDEDKEIYAKIQEELSLMTLKFGKNVLGATNAFTLNITDENELAGLPQYVRDMAASEAKAKNKEGWLFTLDQPSYSPFMKYSENRALREKMWRAYNSKCIGGEFDNTETVKKIAELRIREAQILGYRTYADYALEDRMAKTPEIVNSFLADLAKKSLPFAKRDVAEIQKYASQNGFKDNLMPWDFSYWSEKYQDEKYALNDELLKPYFELHSVQNAIFDLANRLYGLKFKENNNIPKYHPDVQVFEVTDETGRFMALLYMDFFPRESKRGGAWMTSFREQGKFNGEEERPFVSVVTNFTKPTETTPSLLTFYEFTTILHEFGHALHGILAEGTYSSLTGTNVARDFVELPSQIMENWAYEPEYLQSFAKHYQSGEVIPQELIDKIIAAKNYLAGYSSIRQLQFGITDMAWHTIENIPQESVVEYEQNALSKTAVLPAVGGVVFSPSFSHIFAGGYAAGYYSYKWAEVLEADAFALFKEKGIFNREVAKSFKENILSRGGIEDADVLYRNFRGRDPQPEALLVKLGMTK
ncbi:MAG: M3 family metallopeptidase [Bacteroidales bacterium]|nr:M3 family metallopeptidase [Bacteroidales bacterium]MDD4669810.1 M3 family metallopeptidase [Bacteroidales bacterium]